MHARLFSSSRSRHISKTDLPKILSLDLLWCADILLKVFTCVIVRVVLLKEGIYMHPNPWWNLCTPAVLYTVTIDNARIEFNARMIIISCYRNE